MLPSSRSPVPARVTPIFLLLAAAAAAQGPSDWTSVSRLIAGTEIRVALRDGHKVQGRFHEATDDALAVATLKSQQTLSRANIAKVSLKRANHRLRDILIGFGAGAGGGLIAGAVSDAQCAKNCFFGNNFGKAVLTPFGALIGLIVGAVLPTGGWRDVYRAPSPVGAQPPARAALP